MSYEKIQPDSDGRDAVRRRVQKRIDRRESREALQQNATTRELINIAEEAFSGESTVPVVDVVAELRADLLDRDLADVLNPTDDRLSAREKLLVERLRREDADRVPIQAQFEVLVSVARALGIIASYSDRTRYAPVTFESLDIPGAESRVDEPTPVGRVRVGSASAMDVDDRAVEIPHADCEHVMVVANPRKGKDNIIVRCCCNLKDEHGYKYISLHDDGRNETPMLAIPSDDPRVQDALDEFGQDPKGYQTRVYVPAVESLPSELPGNFEPFAIGVDNLTAELIGNLAGVSPAASTERRIKAALDEVRDTTGRVDDLITRLHALADETTAQVTVTELQDDDEVAADADDAGSEDGEAESYTKSYEMGEDDLLEDCAKALVMLSSQGLLRDRGDPVNLDMHAEIAAQDRVAVLNCNYLPDGDEHLKYLITNIWLRLIYRARDDDPSLPRVALEIRELKNLAPSKIKDAKYKSIIKGVQQTLYFLSTQGGSRRIMMLGSTQKLNDVYKAIRSNMPIRILLQMGPEKVKTLESSGFVFSDEEVRQLNDFPVGWGMYLGHGEKKYPIQWCGARCGLGLGDEFWLDRYGRAAGWRVHTNADEWRWDDKHYVTPHGRVRDAPPERGDWYLLADDIDVDPTVPTVKPCWTRLVQRLAVANTHRSRRTCRSSRSAWTCARPSNANSI